MTDPGVDSFRPKSHIFTFPFRSVILMDLPSIHGDHMLQYTLGHIVINTLGPLIAKLIDRRLPGSTFPRIVSKLSRSLLSKCKSSKTSMAQLQLYLRFVSWRCWLVVRYTADGAEEAPMCSRRDDKRLQQQFFQYSSLVHCCAAKILGGFDCILSSPSWWDFRTQFPNSSLSCASCEFLGNLRSTDCHGRHFGFKFRYGLFKFSSCWFNSYLYD